MKEIDLNGIVKIQLNEFGKNIYEKWAADATSSSQNIKDYFLSQIDEDDCLTIEFWRAMNIFGLYLNNGNNISPFLSMTLLIDEKYINDYDQGKSL